LYTYVNVSLRTDIKECTTGNNTCAQSCLELEGSYECGCNETGYVLQTDNSCEGKA